jgi:hypothetical protein
MVKRSVLNNWNNGNFDDIDRHDLIQLALYFECFVDRSFTEDIEEDIEED